jgi:hypothetical protein
MCMPENPKGGALFCLKRHSFVIRLMRARDRKRLSTSQRGHAFICSVIPGHMGDS